MKKNKPEARSKTGTGKGSLRVKFVSSKPAKSLQAGGYPAKQPAGAVLEIPSIKVIHQLPAPPEYFSGREKELKAVLHNLQHGVLITGRVIAAGIGKTAFGLVLADRLLNRYPDGQIFLDLRGASTQEPLTPAQAMRCILHDIDPQERLPQDEDALAAHYRSVLQGRLLLLFLDNARDQAQVLPLVSPKGSLTLVTSRRQFRLETLVLDGLAPRDARRLMYRIAARMKSTKAGTIARQCNYLPLALKLAAGILATHPDWEPALLAKKMKEKKAVADSLQTCLELSYGVLDEKMQLRFRQLGVFPASFDREAAGAVWAACEEETGIWLEFFKQAGLLEFDRVSGRYVLHEQMEDFAMRKLSPEEQAAARRRHAWHYLQVFSEAEALYWKGGENITAGLAAFDREEQHIRRGQAWAAASDLELANAYPGVGAALLRLRLEARERIAWRETSLAAARQLQDRRAESVHLGHLGLDHKELGEFHKALAFHRDALLIDRETGNRDCEEADLGNLGNTCIAMGEPARAMEFYEKALALARELDDQPGEGIALANMGDAIYNQGERPRGVELVRQALAIFSAIGSPQAEWARKWLEQWGERV